MCQIRLKQLNAHRSNKFVPNALSHPKLILTEQICANAFLKTPKPLPSNCTKWVFEFPKNATRHEKTVPTCVFAVTHTLRTKFCRIRSWQKVFQKSVLALNAFSTKLNSKVPENALFFFKALKQFVSKLSNKTKIFKQIIKKDHNLWANFR